MAAGDDPAWKVYEGWPFDAPEAARRQAETAAAMKITDPLNISLGADGAAPTVGFRLIPAGAFEMGSPNSESGHEGDERLHAEKIAEPFYMMETQLTLEAYRALRHADPPGMAADADPKLPAAVTYREAMDQVLPELAKKVPKGWKIILPDHARIEYAARAGCATMNHGGNQPADADAHAWTKENSENKVHPVALKKPNAWGLYDVIGNRWHWYWAGPAGGYGDASTKDHIVYGGTYSAPASGNGARLANIMISSKSEGVRFALLREETPMPQSHPDARMPKPDK